MLNVFGFEFSLANSILLFFISGIFTLKYFAKRQILFERGEINVKKVGIIFLIFLAIPLLVSLTNSLFTMICSLRDGFLFYLVITVPSVILGAATGLIVFTFIKKFRILSFILLVIFILMIPFFEFYFNPQVYFFNPVFGFLPGTIYDEGIKVTSKLLLYRILNLIFFGSVILIILKRSSGKFFKIFLAIYLLLIPSLFLYFSPMLGFSTTNISLQKVLTVNFKTAHFDIYFASGIPNTLAKKITVEHEYDYKILTKFFKLYPQGKITSYIFDSDEQKGKYFGSSNADVAKPWLKQIYVSADSYDQTLRHELAHVFTAGFGIGIFKVADKLNPAMIEGAAVAASPFYDDNTIDYMAKLAYQNGYKINIEHLFSGFNFFGKVSSISYIYAGSFSKFLINRYGIGKFESLYSNINFDKVYNEPVREITKAYYNFLDSLSIDKNINEANYYFGRQSIFQKVCPRYVGERLKTAWNYYIANNYKKAGEVFMEILNKTNNYSALVGLSSTLLKMKDTTKAAEIIQANINKFNDTAYYYNLELRLADLNVLNSDFGLADSLYIKLLNENPSRSLLNISELRIALSKDNSLLKQYVAGSNAQKLEILEKINIVDTVYSSIPTAVVLSNIVGQNYNAFISRFNRKFNVYNYSSSYAMFKLSGYMMDNLDFANAREIAKLAMNFKNDENFNEILKSNFEKANWFYYNADSILTNIK